MVPPLIANLRHKAALAAMRWLDAGHAMLGRADPRSWRAGRARLAIAAIMKNEAPYILEWIAFHRVIGVEQFFVADNESDDGSSALLAALHTAGIIVHLPFPSGRAASVQIAAYSRIIARHGHRADWLAFIDADEFLLPDRGDEALPALLAAMPPDIGAIAVNWAIYGSSSQLTAAPELVLERFTQRAAEAFPANCHYKSIVRTEALLGTHANPHAMRLRPGFRYVHADQSPLVVHPRLGEGLSERVHWEKLKLAHFVVKSRAEFEQKKAPRGRASSVDAKPRDAGFFAVHDRNEVTDPVAAELIAATRVEMAALRRRLR